MKAEGQRAKVTDSGNLEAESWTPAWVLGRDFSPLPPKARSLSGNWQACLPIYLCGYGADLGFSIWAPVCLCSVFGEVRSWYSHLVLSRNSFDSLLRGLRPGGALGD